nr:hypothetical protein [Marininema mesophilum]
MARLAADGLRFAEMFG